MHAGEPPLAGPGVADSRTSSSASVLEPGTAQEPAGQRGQGRRWWVAVGWIGVLLGLIAVFLRIALSLEVDADGANNALQAWDLLHGNILLHHWIIGDATYYTFDLPALALGEIFVGLHSTAIHVGPAITLAVVVISAMAVARTGSRGTAAAARAIVVLAVICAAFGSYSSTWIALAKPDHMATGAFLLVSFLLLDRMPERRFTAPLLFVILCAGQLGDALVLYVAVPTIVLVSVYRAAIARKVRSADTVIALAALLSVPATLLIRAVMRHLGAYVMVAPRIQLAPWHLLSHNAYLTVRSIVILYGTQLPSDGPLGIAGVVFGIACMLAAVFGFLRVVVTWRRASRAEQMLCVGIVINVAAYLFSTLPVIDNPREVAALLPFGAVLAARALVPARFANAMRARTAIAVASVAVLVPMIAAASQPVLTPTANQLVSWLEAHGLKYGIAGYWNASDVTVVSGDRVQVRAVQPWRGHLAQADWETDTAWYNASKYDATFAVAGIGHYARSLLPASFFEHYLGRPAAIYTVDNTQVLLYRQNLLRFVIPGPVSAGRTPTASPDVRIDSAGVR